MKNVFLHAVLATLLILNYGCGSSACKEEDVKLTVHVEEFTCWLNLMPGGPGSFHFSGNLLISNEENFMIDDLKFGKVFVLQDAREIYAVNASSNPVNSSINPGEQLAVSIFTNDNHRIKSELDQDKPVDFIIWLSTAQGKKSVKITNVQIERAY